VALTNPTIVMFARGDNEYLASGARDRDGAAHDPRPRGVFLAHIVLVAVRGVGNGVRTGGSSLSGAG
jgi:hypothetical protein